MGKVGLFLEIILLYLLAVMNLCQPLNLSIEPVDSSGSESTPSSADKLRTVLKSFGELCASNKECAFPFVCDTDKTKSCICGTNRVAQRMMLSRTKGSSISSQNSRITCVLRAGASCSTRLELSPGGKYYQESIKNFGKVFLSHLGLASKKLRDQEIFGEGGLMGSNGGSGCVENSRCDGYICLCNPGHFKDTKSGLCLKKRSMFQKCERDDECGSVGDDSEEQILSCGRTSGRCECPPHLTFDIRTMKCHIPAGGKCDYFPIGEEDECVPNAECIEGEGRCKCLYGFRKALDGNCAVDHGLPCGNGRTCADMDLVCRSGTCVCKFPAHQYFDEEKEACVGKPGAPCDLMITSKPNETDLFTCTENAFCASRSRHNVSQDDRECQCVDGFAEDENGKCVKSFGAECDDDDSECDKLGQLVCLNGKCGCPDALQVFDKETRKCRGLIGSRCRNRKVGEKYTDFRTNAVPYDCIEHAVCSEKVEGIDGRCECKLGYEEMNGTRRCIRKSSKFLYQWSGEQV
jgi:hypothetical protein